MDHKPYSQDLPRLKYYTTQPNAKSLMKEITQKLFLILTKVKTILSFYNVYFDPFQVFKKNFNLY